MRNQRAFIVIVLTATVLFGCRTVRTVPTAAHDLELPAAQLLDSVDAHGAFSLLRARISVTYNSENDSRNFGVRARLKKDSIIWLSITPALGIEVFRLVITPDTIKMLNRLDNKYFIHSFSDAKEILKVDVDFGTLQAFLTGCGESERMSDKCTMSSYQGGYQVSSTNGDDEDGTDTGHQQWDIDRQTWRITRMLFDRPERQEQIAAGYSDFLQVQNLLFPTAMQFSIQAKENIGITLKWTKVEEQNTLRFPFNIPHRYVAY